ncbi:carbohydrate-binding module family 66 protein [Trichoderma sp. SZMC 28013]
MGSQVSSPVFLDNGEFFMDTNNIVNVSWPNVSDAFSKPVAMSSSSFPGYDWTQPYPGGGLIDGHSVQLTVAPEVLMNETVVENSTTVLSSLTFSLPDSMVSSGKILPMDPSWYICRHIFISTDAATKASADQAEPGCHTLPQTCLDDLSSTLTNDWGKADNNSMCAQLIYDPIPESCVSSFGFSRQDVLAADSTTIADSVLGPLQTSNQQQQYSWRIGTGYRDPGDSRAYEIAANRTYLVATVWGYSKAANPKTIKVPGVTWTCISSGDAYVPASPLLSSTTTTSSGPTSTPTAIPVTDAFYDDFTAGMDQWITYDGSYRVDSGALVTDESQGGKAMLHTTYNNFTFEADITLPTDSGNAGLIFRAVSADIGADAYRGYYAGISTENNVVLGLAEYNWTQLSLVDMTVKANQVHHVKVRALGSTIDVFVDDMTKAKISTKHTAYIFGMDGVRVFDTGATFDNIQILPVAFGEDFASGKIDTWNTYGGSFAVQSAALVAQSSSGGKALIANKLFGDFVYEADMTITDANGNAGLVFRVSNPYDGADGYYGYYAGIGNGFVVLGRADDNWNELSNVSAASVKIGTVHHIMVKAKGDSLSVYVDDMNTPKISLQDDTYRLGSNGVRVYQTEATVDNIVIYTM